MKKLLSFLIICMGISSLPFFSQEMTTTISTNNDMKTPAKFKGCPFPAKKPITTPATLPAEPSTSVTTEEVTGKLPEESFVTEESIATTPVISETITQPSIPESTTVTIEATPSVTAPSTTETIGTISVPATMPTPEPLSTTPIQPTTEMEPQPAASSQIETSSEPTPVESSIQ